MPVLVPEYAWGSHSYQNRAAGAAWKWCSPALLDGIRQWYYWGVGIKISNRVRWATRGVEWSVGDSRIVWMGTRAKGCALFIFDFGLHVDLVFHEALARHVKLGQQRELDLRM